MNTMRIQDGVQSNIGEIEPAVCRRENKKLY